MARYKLKGPLKHANLQAECEALQSKAEDVQAALGAKLRLWLQTRPDTAAAFSGSGLENFFASYPRQVHFLCLPSDRGIIPPSSPDLRSFVQATPRAARLRHAPPHAHPRVRYANVASMTNTLFFSFSFSRSLKHVAAHSAINTRDLGRRNRRNGGYRSDGGECTRPPCPVSTLGSGARRSLRFLFLTSNF